MVGLILGIVCAALIGLGIWGLLSWLDDIDGQENWHD